jgi:hypothetical protein
VKWPGLPQRDLLGVRFALNAFLASAILWYLLRHVADTNPIWAIASIAASEPQVKEAARMFRSRIVNVLVGCAVGLLFLVIGGASEWKLPVAMAVAVLIILVRGPHPDNVASSADNGRPCHRGRPDPPFQVERHREWPAQGWGSTLSHGTVRELAHVPDLVPTGSAGQGRIGSLRLVTAPGGSKGPYGWDLRSQRCRVVTFSARPRNFPSSQPIEVWARGCFARSVEVRAVVAISTLRSDFLGVEYQD